MPSFVSWGGGQISCYSDHTCQQNSLRLKTSTNFEKRKFKLTTSELKPNIPSETSEPWACECDNTLTTPSEPKLLNDKSTKLNLAQLNNLQRKPYYCCDHSQRNPYFSTLYTQVSHINFIFCSNCYMYPLSVISTIIDRHISISGIFWKFCFCYVHTW